MSDERGKSYELDYDVQHMSCPDCFYRLRWDVHNPGEFMQYWIAQCRCPDRVWQMDLETVRVRHSQEPFKILGLDHDG